ncbi:MAG: YebC/PmpR family DNA-binding transcriptional regulator [Porticoccaceae bacterium]|nr:YebC/PmpR family DNA-binding transcriptional regulator [Gammaproteobacteria bacterium]TAL02510.1 MAG: YebC/PmpR family DNA-binding transcriptional regulator [Porticoccaceae bacterium]
MAGHSKWANIKHRKAAQDAQRGKLFTKLIRELVTAARTGGGTPDDNPRLRTAIDKALSVNMKRDTIDKAIQRGAGAGDAENYEEVTYEGYGAGGVALLVECLTDNRNRTVADVRHAFSKRGGNLGTDGSVAYLFNRRGQLTYPPGCDEDRIIEIALEAGAEDVVSNDDGSVDVLSGWQDFAAVKAAMTAAGLTPEHAEVAMIPLTTVAPDAESAVAVITLIDQLEDLDDVQNVYTNADLSAAP